MEVAEAENFLALRSEDPKKYFLNGGWTIQWNGDYKVAGTTFTYKRMGNWENLTSPGPTEEPVWIQVGKGGFAAGLWRTGSRGWRVASSVLRSLLGQGCLCRRWLPWSWSHQFLLPRGLLENSSSGRVASQPCLESLKSAWGSPGAEMGFGTKDIAFILRFYICVFFF